MRILITGAARGLGWHMSREAARRGHTVFAAVRPESDAVDLEALSKEYHDLVHILRMDVSSEEQVHTAARLLYEQFGALDGIINNAAVTMGGEDTIETLDLDLVRQTMEVNLLGAMRVVQEYLPLLYKGEQQAIINISSEAGTIINAFPKNYPYAISKTALNMFTERLRAHLLEKDIRVYAIHPGWMRTAMGGSEAPADPQVVAGGVLNILEGKTKTNSKIAFIDATGRPMPL
ncbi:MAG: SDR family NAD(P)-dependent oxidoreductase [Acetanaerobacterium sp.]